MSFDRYRRESHWLTAPPGRFSAASTAAGMVGSHLGGRIDLLGPGQGRGHEDAAGSRRPRRLHVPADVADHHAVGGPHAQPRGPPTAPFPAPVCGRRTRRPRRARRSPRRRRGRASPSSTRAFTAASSPSVMRPPATPDWLVITPIGDADRPQPIEGGPRAGHRGRHVWRRCCRGGRTIRVPSRSKRIARMSSGLPEKPTDDVSAGRTTCADVPHGRRSAPPSSASRLFSTRKRVP